MNQQVNEAEAINVNIEENSIFEELNQQKVESVQQNTEQKTQQNCVNQWCNENSPFKTDENINIPQFITIYDDNLKSIKCSNNACSTLLFHTHPKLSRIKLQKGFKWYCQACYLAVKHKQYCPYCFFIYLDPNATSVADDKEWIGCDNSKCGRWVHVDCEEKQGEQQIREFLNDQVYKYYCCECRTKQRKQLLLQKRERVQAPKKRKYTKKQHQNDQMVIIQENGNMNKIEEMLKKRKQNSYQYQKTQLFIGGGYGNLDLSMSQSLFIDNKQQLDDQIANIGSNFIKNCKTSNLFKQHQTMYSLCNIDQLLRSYGNNCLELEETQVLQDLEVLRKLSGQQYTETTKPAEENKNSYQNERSYEHSDQTENQSQINQQQQGDNYQYTYSSEDQIQQDEEVHFRIKKRMLRSNKRRQVQYTELF